MQHIQAPFKEQLTQALQELFNEIPERPPAKYPNHLEGIMPWVNAMQVGNLTGKPFSYHTVNNYLRYVKYFVTKYGDLTYENLEDEFLNTPVEMFGRKDKFHRAIMCFAKFLVRENSLTPEFITKAMQIKPKRHKPPKRTTLNEKQLEAVFQACDTIEQQLTIQLLANTGLRASEFCSLKMEDIDFENSCLTVQQGKGGKRRKVGLNEMVTTLLQEYLKQRRKASKDNYVFLNKFGEKMERCGLLNRIRRLGKKTNIPVSPHALRRAFVTINANKGRSLVMLQIACGHSDIKTTRSYCQTSEDEVIQAMKAW